MIGPIPFDAPAKFATGLNDGNILRLGAILKDAQTGKILGHLQETGLAQKLLSSVSLSPFSPISALSSLGANFQLHQLTKLTESLKILQFATLGASIAGIGVSALGFYLVNTKINAVQANIADLRKDIKKHFGQAHLRELRQHFSRVTGLCTDAKAVASLNDPEKEWIEIGRRFSDERAYFFGEVKHLLEQETIDKNCLHRS